MRPETLRATLACFNAAAGALDDAEFGRGRGVADLAGGDPALDGPARTLGPLRSRPLCATRVYAGTSDTTVGPGIDAAGRVPIRCGRGHPRPVRGGNVTAAVVAGRNVGAGGALGPALTFGLLAARTASGMTKCGPI